ncbi:Nucleoporin Nup43 [Balamuthia mandrillaris]
MEGRGRGGGEAWSLAAYLGTNVTSVCWLPRCDHRTRTAYLLTGTSDESINKVGLWSFSLPDWEDEEEETGPQPPSPLADNVVFGSVAGLKVVERDSSLFALSVTTHGNLNVHKVFFDTSSSLSKEDRLKRTSTWERLHRSACTAFDVRAESNEIVTAGEDGALHFVQLEQAITKPHLSIENADSSGVSSVHFISSHSVLSVGSTGHLKLFDLRTNSNAQQDFTMVKTMKDAGSSILQCAAVHPHQPSFVVTGAHDGSIAFWDLRHPKWPFQSYAQHTADVWDIQFHAAHPDNVISASEDGTLLLWNFNPKNEMRGTFTADKEQLLLRKLLRQRVGLNSLAVLPEMNMLCCAADNEALLFLGELLPE